MTQRVTPCIWFEKDAQEAAEFYVSLLPDSKITNVTHYPDGAEVPDGITRESGTVLTVEFELAGQAFTILNGGPGHPLSDAVSFMITCRDQDEVDRLWDRFTADGGQEVACGWVTDKYGVSWQVIPEGFVEAMNNPDPEATKRAFDAMMKMKKLDLAALQAAAAGTG